MAVRGLSEVFSSVLLLVITVALSAFVVAVFFNVVYGPSVSRLAVEGASQLCMGRVFAVVNASKRAWLYVVNTGSVPCAFDRAYLVVGGSVVNASLAWWCWGGGPVPPGGVGCVATQLAYNATARYRLTGPRGEYVED